MEALEARLDIVPDEDDPRVVVISRPSDQFHYEVMDIQRRKYNRCAAILDIYERRVLAKFRSQVEFTLS